MYNRKLINGLIIANEALDNKIFADREIYENMFKSVLTCSRKVRRRHSGDDKLQDLSCKLYNALRREGIRLNEKISNEIYEMLYC